MAEFSAQSLMAFSTLASMIVNRSDLERLLYSIAVTMTEMVRAVILGGQISAGNLCFYWEIQTKATSQKNLVQKAEKSSYFFFLHLSKPRLPS